ncbi:hypothetical protein BV911_02390 [Pseudoruegeria sp. SK021]|nr:hypothetical protein BV911_02390 [Pseudoruegeria sp. SK021]
MSVDPEKKRRVSAVWLVPLIALGISLFIAWQTYSSRGPLIEITFTNGDGVAANETALKYRQIKVGTVESVRFADNLQKVIVSVRVDKSIAPFINEDAKFWIVRPEVSARGITGLTTVLGGVFLEGAWDDTPGPTATTFTGLDNQPLITGTDKGVEFYLTAQDANRIQAGAPIVFKGVTVGLIDMPSLTADGSAVTARAFVRAPHDTLVTDASRFWATSGFSVNLGAQGLSVDVANLSALVQGGTTFSSFDYHNASPIKNGHVFTVYKDQNEAKSASFVANDVSDVALSVLFEGSVSGLAVGSAVAFHGLQVGTVAAMQPIVDSVDGKDIIKMRADLSVQPARLGLPEGSSKDDLTAFFTNLAAQGYRARLASVGLLGTTLQVEILEVADAPAATLQTTADGNLVLPTTAPSVSDIAVTAKGALQRLDDLPIEEFVQNAVNLVQNLNKVVSSPQVQEAPQEVVALLKEARDLISSESITSLAGQADQTIASVRAIVDQVAESEGLKKLLTALDRSDAIAKSIEDTASGLPPLLKEIEAVAAKAKNLPLDQLMTSATDLVASAEQLMASDQITALPTQLATAMDDVNASLANVRDISGKFAQSDAVATLIAALDRTGTIAKSIETATDGLPDLMARINAVASTAENLPLNELVTSADTLVQSANALVSSPDTAKIPAALAGALDEVGAALAELREGGAVENTNATLASARSAAAAVETAAASLPELSARLESLVVQGETLMSAYGTKSQFNLQTLSLLNDLRETARSVTSLSRAIERKPNSLLIGR